MDNHRFVVPSDAPPGPTHVLLTLAPDGVNPVQRAVADVDLGAIDVLDRPIRLTPPPDVEHHSNWRIGSFADLVGFSINETSARPGDHLQLTLYWKALGNSGNVGYTVFSHLLDQKEIIAAQQDHPPADGQDPTSGWIAGEYIVDHYDLAIKPDAAPGTYQIEIGMYDPATGIRLPVRAASGADIGDRVVLTTVQLK